MALKTEHFQKQTPKRSGGRTFPEGFQTEPVLYGTAGSGRKKSKPNLKDHNAFGTATFDNK